MPEELPPSAAGKQVYILHTEQENGCDHQVYVYRKEENAYAAAASFIEESLEHLRDKDEECAALYQRLQNARSLEAIKEVLSAFGDWQDYHEQCVWVERDKIYEVEGKREEKFIGRILGLRVEEIDAEEPSADAKEGAVVTADDDGDDEGPEIAWSEQ